MASNTPQMKSGSAAKAGRPKSSEKRQQILTAAAELFLQNGITNTSMDLVAGRSGVAKQTVYSHFRNKDALYSAVIDMKCQEYQFDASHLSLEQTSPEQLLNNMGIRLLQLFHDKKVIAMYRVVIAEATTNPHVAELFSQQGPQRTVNMLATLLHQHPQLGLSEKCCRKLAIDFFNLIKGEFHMQSLLGLARDMNEEQQQRHVGRATKQILHLIELESE